MRTSRRPRRRKIADAAFEKAGQNRTRPQRNIGSGAWPSGRSVALAAMTIRANPASTTKIHCQPAVAAMKPPIEGVNNGETLNTRTSKAGLTVIFPPGSYRERANCGNAGKYISTENGLTVLNAPRMRMMKRLLRGRVMKGLK